ncbi:OLC1v1009938C1 [Oldenlandia corymbosa var. corymbosa]|uniref:OLC1v1009938C1 n=1 Tax=Oldenlandia corymbosa var. corymbosa TaxID=529605 RepID=A0AAV1DQ24_OLDCO|nr:OLC1v1009938C1 [Oldenlandia corymbosa var. corymbosa]
MEPEEIISLGADSPGGGDEIDELNSKCESENHMVEEVKEIGEISGSSGDDLDRETQCLPVADNGDIMIETPPSFEISVETSETVAVTETMASSLPVQAENVCLTAKTETILSNDRGDDLPPSDREISASSLSGVKRRRVTVDEELPSVKVAYKSLTRDSKRKLEELLQQWSKWHAQHCSSSTELGNALESGEDTYFPAIQVGTNKSSAVSFWMESETRENVNKLIEPDEKFVPLYDRGFSLALTSMDGSNNQGILEVGEGSRCFNCGSYSHSLKECPKPRDNAAVNNARKQHISRRNQNASSRNPTRYYQNTPGGKYDGLKPGTLDPETRKLLGLGELDPPPWLNRMRQIGYPPAYFAVEEEDQPSGITIFGDDEIIEDGEEGEILENSFTKPDKRMIVKFPGVNAPIPEKADKKLWSTRPAESSLYRDRSSSRYNQTPDSRSRGYFHDRRPPSRGFDDDEPPPPGCENESPTAFGNSRRHSTSDSAYYSQRDSLEPRSSSFGRSFSERGRRHPLDRDGSLHHSYGYLSSSSPR